MLFICLGTKSDLRQIDSKNSIKSTDGDLLRRIIKADEFIECSSKFMHNVEAIFQEALLAYVKHNEPIQKRKKSCCVLWKLLILKNVNFDIKTKAIVSKLRWLTKENSLLIIVM